MKLFSLIFTLLVSITAMNAQTYTGIAVITGANEVPLNTSPAIGSLTCTYDAATGMINLHATYSNLQGTLTVSHLHANVAGANGGVILNLNPTAGSSSGVISGTFAFPAANEAALLSGGIYINIHSSAFGGGEIRGQLILHQIGGNLLTSGQPASSVDHITSEGGDFYVTRNIHGVILTSPNNDCFRIRVLDNGRVITEPVVCP